MKELLSPLYIGLIRLKIKNTKKIRLSYLIINRGQIKAHSILI